MKVRLLKDWTNPADGKKHAAGSVVEIDDAKGATLVEIEAAEKVADAADAQGVVAEAMAGLKGEIEATVAAAVKDAAKGFTLKSGRIEGGAPADDEDGMCGFKCDDDFYRSVYRSSSKAAMPDPRLAKVAEVYKRKMFDRYPQLKDIPEAYGKVAAVGTGEAGGFLVPEETSNRIFSRMQAKLGGIIEQCDHLVLSGYSVRVPAVSDASRAAAATRYGGIVVYNVAEAAQITEASLKFRELRLEPHKKAALAGATEEMLSCIANFGDRMTAQMGDAIGDEVVEDVMFGNGVGVCQGAFTSACCISVPKEADQAADTIVSKNIINMEAYLYGDGEFYYHPEAHTQLSLLTLTVGTSGIPLMVAAGGFTNAPFTTIRGRRATKTDHCEKLGDAGDIVLANWSQYMLATRGGIKTDMSIHLWFDYDKTAFKATFEVDGRPAWETSLTPRKGATATRISPFLKVAERA